MEPYVLLEENFLRDFLQCPRASYMQCYEQGGEEGLKTIYPEGNLLVILQEVGTHNVYDTPGLKWHISTMLYTSLFFLLCYGIHA